MPEFNTINKVFIKSPNQSNKLISRYFYALMTFYPLTIIFFYLTKHLDLILPLLTSLSIALISTIIFDYIINLIKPNRYSLISKVIAIYTFISVVVFFLPMNLIKRLCQI